MGWGECLATESCGDGMVNGGEECEYDANCQTGEVCNGCVFVRHNVHQ